MFGSNVYANGFLRIWTGSYVPDKVCFPPAVSSSESDLA